MLSTNKIRALRAAAAVILACGMLSFHGSALARRDGGTLGESAFQTADWIFQHATSTHYKHNKLPAAKQLSLSKDACRIDADCSGFVSFVLDRVAPRQYEAIRLQQPERPYPQSKTFANFFASLSDRTPTSGWIRVPRVSELRRGDLIAWERVLPPGKRGNTGHVMLVAEKPGAVQIIDGKRFASVLVLDCSSVKHFPPERLPPNAHQSQRDGLGKGVVRLLLDYRDRPIGYWEGSYWGEQDRPITKPSLSSTIGFGRLVRAN